MSHIAVDQFVGQIDAQPVHDAPVDPVDRAERLVQAVSRLAGYGSLAAAVAGLAYIAIR